MMNLEMKSKSINPIFNRQNHLMNRKNRPNYQPKILKFKKNNKIILWSFRNPQYMKNILRNKKKLISNKMIKKNYNKMIMQYSKMFFKI